jgi:hypothetical protein
MRILRPVVVMLLAGAAARAGAQTKNPNASPALRPIDSVRVAENDALLLSRPNRLVVGPHGNYFVTDGAESRIVEIAPSGKIVRTFGRKGSVPGEFQAPGSLAVSGDSLLAVMDVGLARVALFDLRTGKYKSGFPLPPGFPPPNLRIQGASIFAGFLHSDRRSAIVEHSFTGVRISAEGMAPTLFTTHPEFIGPFGAVNFALSGSDTYAVFEVSQSLFHWKRGAQTGDEVLVPAIRRKGVKPGLFEALLKDPSKGETIAFDRSVPYSLSVVGPNVLGLVTLDGTLMNSVFSGTYWVTVIDLGRHRVCADLEVPAPRDPRPLVALSGDTLVVLQQGTDATGQPASAIRRLRIVTDGCAFMRTEDRRRNEK